MAELTEEQILLRQELNKLSKRANQRILEIERFTKRKSPQFAVKELADLLSQSKGLTKRKGKSIRASQYKKSMTETDIQASVKALRNFVYNQKEFSTIRGIKKYIAKTSKKVYGEDSKKKLPPAEASTIYLAGKEWKWIEDYTDGSEFWKYYDYEFKKSPPSLEQFIDYLTGNLFDSSVIVDKNMRKRLEKLRIYLMKDL